VSEVDIKAWQKPEVKEKVQDDASLTVLCEILPKQPLPPKAKLEPKVAPEIEILEIMSPEVEVPEVEISKIMAPEVEPSEMTPEVEILEIMELEVEAPEVEDLEIMVPEVEASEVMPDDDIIEIMVPEVEASKVEVLEIIAREVEALEVAPEVKFPDFVALEETEVPSPKRKRQKTNLLQCTLCNEVFVGRDDCLAHMQKSHEHEVTEVDIKAWQKPEVKEEVLDDASLTVYCEILRKQPLPSKAKLELKVEAPEVVPEIEFPDFVALEDTEVPSPKRKRQKTNLFQCTLCDEVFVGRDDCLAHLRKSHEHEVFACNLDEQCSFIFSSQFELSRHQWHSHRDLVKRTPCRKGASIVVPPAPPPSNLNVLVRGRLRKTRCLYCTKSFAARHRLIVHMKLFHLDRMFKCRLLRCGRIYSSQRKLDDHLEADHKDTVRCYLCGKVFASKQTMENHMLNQHLLTPQRSARLAKRRNKDGTLCPHCGQKFLVLKLHTKTMHPEKMLHCPAESCSMLFVQQTELNAHIQKRHLRNCPFCPNKLDNLKAKYKHIRQMHSDQLIQCPQKDCKLKFIAARDLDKHILRKHVNSNSSANHETSLAEEHMDTSIRYIILYALLPFKILGNFY